ncbi:MAG: GIY-YIG nuclease family protein [Thiofilum sp.]
MFDYEDGYTSLYHPSWNRFTGSMTASVWLWKVVYHWKRNGEKPFYKFDQPCLHENYIDGESWSEELGLSRIDLEFCRKSIGEKTKKEIYNAGRLGNSLVYFWRDQFRRTWYYVNYDLLMSVLESGEGFNMVEKYRETSGYVYLLRVVGDNIYKIGMTTKTPDERVTQFSVKMPFKVEIVETIYYDGDVSILEVFFHNYFTGIGCERINGEWFRLSPEEVSFFIKTKREVEGQRN